MKKIIFDFDYTLFNSKKYRLALQESFLKMGIKERDYKETVEMAKEKSLFYSLSRQTALLRNRYPKIPRIRFDIIWRKIDREMKTFLYSDSLDFLKKIKKRYEVFIVSCGDTKTQGHKIKHSGIERYFKNIFIERSENKNIAIKKIFKREEEVFFIDDNPFILMAAKKEFPNLIIIRINRGQGKYATDKNNYPIDFLIKNFKELEKILNNENFKNRKEKSSTNY